MSFLHRHDAIRVCQWHCHHHDHPHHRSQFTICSAKRSVCPSTLQWHCTFQLFDSFTVNCLHQSICRAVDVVPVFITVVSVRHCHNFQIFFMWFHLYKSRTHKIGFNVATGYFDLPMMIRHGIDRRKQALYWRLLLAIFTEFVGMLPLDGQPFRLLTVTGSWLFFTRLRFVAIF